MASEENQVVQWVQLVQLGMRPDSRPGWPKSGENGIRQSAIYWLVQLRMRPNRDHAGSRVTKTALDRVVIYWYLGSTRALSDALQTSWYPGSGQTRSPVDRRAPTSSLMCFDTVFVSAPSDLTGSTSAGCVCFALFADLSLFGSSVHWP